MSQRIMMGLGDFRFGLSTAAYQRLQRSTEYRWEEQARVGREPALQFIGRSLASVDLEGVIYPTFRGGLSQVDAMRDMAGMGEPLTLVDGTGKVWGEYCILGVGDAQTGFTDDGRARKIEFTVRLKEYGEDVA